MSDFTEEEIQQLRALLPQANAEEAAEIAEEAAEIIEEEIAAAAPDEELIEDAAEIIEDAADVVTEEEINEPISENSESGEFASGGGPDAPDVDSGGIDAAGIDVAPIVADSSADGISADFDYADSPPKPSHWWYRKLGRG